MGQVIIDAHLHNNPSVNELILIENETFINFIFTVINGEHGGDFSMRVKEPLISTI